MPASRADDNYQWIQIRDFKPGISDDPGANYPSGAAQRTGTFRCIANRTGALTPLPARSEPFSMPADGTPTDGRYAIDGLYAPPISMLPTVLSFNPDFFPEHELMVGNEWLEGGNRHQKLRRVRRYETPGTAMDTIKSVSAADSATTLTPNGMTFGTTRSLRSDPTMPGVPIVICGWGTGNTFMYLSEFPDDQNTSSNTPYDIFSNNLFILGICCHQGRTVAQLADAYGQGVDTATFMGEGTVWSGTNDVTTANWTTASPAVFVPENPSGFAFLAPMTANELFAVKLYGGVYVTGPLTSAFVTTLPMVTGSEVSQRPAISNQGVWYGNGTSGVQMWAHGDTSQLMSPNLLPDFWLLNPTENEFDSFGGIRYQFARQDEWILVPNNWLYDQQIQSWWRLEDPSILQIRNFTTIARLIYGSESFYSNSYLTPIHSWERGFPALSYSWQSQPQWETIGNVIDIRQIDLRAKGQGTVTVTATGETMSSTVQFQVDSTYPVLSRQNLRVQDANISIKIEAAGATEAPTVYELDVGYYTAQLERNHV